MKIDQPFVVNFVDFRREVELQSFSSAILIPFSYAQEPHGTGGNGDPILKRRTQTFMCTGSQGKAKSPWECGSNLTAVLGDILGKQGRHPPKTGENVACCEGRTLKAKLLGIFSREYSSACVPLEVATLEKSGPTRQC